MAKKLLLRCLKFAARCEFFKIKIWPANKKLWPPATPVKSRMNVW